MYQFEWGTKRLCGKCDTRFYDFRKPMPSCPKCGEDWKEKPNSKVKRTSVIAEKKSASPQEDGEFDGVDLVPPEVDETDDGEGAGALDKDFDNDETMDRD